MDRLQNRVFQALKISDEASELLNLDTLNLEEMEMVNTFKRLRLFFFTSLSLLLMSSYFVSAQSNGDKIADFVNDMPRNALDLPMFWLEMKSTVGWENMILISGYANNQPICNKLLSIVRNDAPNRKFRCSTAN